MTDLNRGQDMPDSRAERVKDKALGKHDDNPGVADHVGEAAGGISGVVAGAAIGQPLDRSNCHWRYRRRNGRMGTGRAVAEAATAITPGDDVYYRRHFESSPGRFGSRTYDEVKPAYYIGHLASRNPDYRNRPFEDIETDLRRGWTSDSKYGAWDEVRGFASEGFTRGRSTLGNVAEESRIARTT